MSGQPTPSRPPQRLPRRLAGRLTAVVLLTALSPALWVVRPAAAQETPYQVDLTGVEDAGLRTALQASSTLFRLVDDPPPSVVGLERRAEADRERLETALRSAGYYAGTIDIRIDDTAEPVAVTIAIDPGPPYRFARVTAITADGAPPPGGPVEPADIGLQPGEPARAPEVVAAQDRLVQRLAQRGYAYARVADRRVVVDHDQRTMEVTYTVVPGPQVRFGEVVIEGLDAVDPSLVRGRLPWRPGDRYEPATVDEARTRLTQLGVFDSVRLHLAEATPEVLEATEARVPVTVTVTERKRRFIGAGINVSTSEGFGATAYWGHRNLFGGAERLTIAAELARVGANAALAGTDVQLSADFRKPDFLTRDQTLILSGVAVREQPPAFERDAIVLTARLERVLTAGLTVSYGATVERQQVRENEVTTDSTLVGLPLAAVYDATNDLLDPTRGFRVAVEGTPYVQAGGNSTAFFPLRLTNSAYYDIVGDGRYVLAGRISLGSILDGDTRDIPADKRFYAGGGGSVRGYGFQKVGPLDDQGDPVGGKSLVEVGAELRFRLTETIGLVPFIDGGNVYDQVLPDVAGSLRWGAGLGARYYTGFGPLRIDVGVPLNRRDGDSRWELYLSLGQAF